MALIYSKKTLTFIKRNYFYCLGYIISLEQKTISNGIKEYVEIKIFVRQSCFLKTLKSQNVIKKKKSDKAQFTIYSEFKCLIEKFDGSKNNPQNSFTAKV